MQVSVYWAWPGIRHLIPQWQKTDIRQWQRWRPYWQYSRSRYRSMPRHRWRTREAYAVPREKREPRPEPWPERCCRFPHRQRPTTPTWNICVRSTVASISPRAPTPPSVTLRRLPTATRTFSASFSGSWPTARCPLMSISTERRSSPTATGSSPGKCSSASAYTRNRPKDRRRTARNSSSMRRMCRSPRCLTITS